MLETENKASVEARTCVTCGKIFYVDLDDEKMRAAKGFGPKRECSECMQARMQLIEEQTRRNRETEESRIVSEGVRIYKSKLLLEAVVTTLFFGFFSIAIMVGIFSHEIPKMGIFIVILLITTILGLWLRYYSL